MKNKTKILIVALVVLLLALAIAYAAFSGSLKVAGTADAEGHFKVVFSKDGTVTTPDHGTAKVNADDPTKMTVSVKLTYPGDGCTVTTPIKNEGTVPAKLTGVKIYKKGTTVAFDNSSSQIEVLVPDVGSDESLAVGESTTRSFTVKWKADSTVETATAEFDIVLEYEQDTSEFAG